MSTSFQDVIAQFKNIIQHLEESEVKSREDGAFFQGAAVILITTEGASFKTFGDVERHGMIGHLEHFKFNLIDEMAKPRQQSEADDHSSAPLN